VQLSGESVSYVDAGTAASEGFARRRRGLWARTPLRMARCVQARGVAGSRPLCMGEQCSIRCPPGAASAQSVSRRSRSLPSSARAATETRLMYDPSTGQRTSASRTVPTHHHQTDRRRHPHRRRLRLRVRPLALPRHRRGDAARTDRPRIHRGRRGHRRRRSPSPYALGGATIRPALRASTQTERRHGCYLRCPRVPGQSWEVSVAPRF
jgi:hypothetical protein